MKTDTAQAVDSAGGASKREPSAEAIERLLAVFRTAAERVPGYRAILKEAGVCPADVKTLADFRTKVPVLDKKGTFGRFQIEDLCLDGAIGKVHFVLPSSGHGGLFSYGVYSPSQALEARQRADAALDAVIGVGRRPTLLINCLPMGVKVPTAACTVAEVSVRPDMATALVRQFASHYEQVLLVSDAAIIKSVLELGRSQGIRWKDLRTHILVGGEMLAENARTYLGSFLDTDLVTPERGLVVSSMGLAEIGLNLFSEIPIGSGRPLTELIRLRRALHRDRSLRESILGPGARIVPMLMTYDPASLFVEVLPDQSLVLTPLEPDRVIPLVRYNTGDKAAFLRLPEVDARRLREAAGLQSDVLESVPILLMYGRGEGVRCGDSFVTPEQVKEGLYADPELAPLTTCNFRLTAAEADAHVKIQLAPGVPADSRLNSRFAEAIAPYVPARAEVTCCRHLDFVEGIETDYERKFMYLQKL